MWDFSFIAFLAAVFVGLPMCKRYMERRYPATLRHALRAFGVWIFLWPIFLFTIFTEPYWERDWDLWWLGLSIAISVFLTTSYVASRFKRVARPFRRPVYQLLLLFDRIKGSKAASALHKAVSAVFSAVNSIFELLEHLLEATLPFVGFLIAAALALLALVAAIWLVKTIWYAV